MEYPRQRYLSRRETVRFRDLAKPVYHLLIGMLSGRVKSLTMHVGLSTRCGFFCFPRPCQPSARQWAPRQDPYSFALAQSQHLAFLFTI